MQSPAGQAPQSITFPNGTTFGGASGREASTLAQIMVDANNNMHEFGKIEASETKSLQTSQQALAVIEPLSQQQGTGEITLFFPTAQTHIRQGTMEYQRLVNFLDYLSRESRRPRASSPHAAGGFVSTCCLRGSARPASTVT